MGRDLPTQPWRTPMRSYGGQGLLGRRAVPGTPTGWAGGRKAAMTGRGSGGTSAFPAADPLG